MSQRSDPAIPLASAESAKRGANNYDYLLQVEVADLPAYEDFHANRLAVRSGLRPHQAARWRATSAMPCPQDASWFAGRYEDPDAL